MTLGLHLDAEEASHYSRFSSAVESKVCRHSYWIHPKNIKYLKVNKFELPIVSLFLSNVIFGYCLQLATHVTEFQALRLDVSHQMHDGSRS